MIRLIVDSDLHFTADGPRADKRDHAARIREVAATNSINAIICAGDLTDMGWDGKRFLCWAYGGAEDQVAPLRRWVEGLAADVAPVYLASGNHDQYVPWPYRHKGVRDFIEQRHGALRYSWRVTAPVPITESLEMQSALNSILGKAPPSPTIIYHAVCLDVYPDRAGREYLRGVMAAHPDDYFIIYFHFNLEGPYSDWWSDAEKNAFAEVLIGHRVALIVCGHWHTTALSQWRGYNVAMGAGSKVALVTLDTGLHGTTASMKLF